MCIRDRMDTSLWLESTVEQKVVLVTLMAMVNHSPQEWEWQGKPYRCQPGQTITSLSSIVEKCGKGISIQNVRTALKRFERLQFIKNQSSNTNRLITICNYSAYQVGFLHNKQITKSQQSHNKRLTPNKNDNNEKKKLSLIHISEPTRPY